jgi:hypothetical protein
MRFSFWDDPYTEYMKLRQRLLVLIGHHKDDSDEAEKLRARMDMLWPKIPETRRMELNKDIALPGTHPHSNHLEK